MIKTIESRYKKLSDREHVLLRPGRYLGSIKTHTALSWIYDEDSKKMIKKEIHYNPALIKITDEIISNSIDEFKRNGSKLDTIKIDIDRDTGEFTVWDNGGIPVVLHKEHEEYVPGMIFKDLKCGSNFDDDAEEMITGQNGEGAALTNIFSKRFTVKTADGKNSFKQVFENNLSIINDPKVKPCNTHFTKISWIPDYERLETSLDEGNYQKIVKRIYDIAACNPKLKISLNGKHIRINSFKDYIRLYTEEFIYDDNEHWRIGVSGSSDGFEHISFVNGENTQIGGSHIDYISNQIVAKLREFFKKKHKVDVKPSDIKTHITLFIDSSIVNPRYSSQTKDELITEVRDYKTSYQVPDKFIRKIIDSPIIQDVLDWIEAKLLANEKAELRKLNKNNLKTNPRRIVKFSDANEKKDRSKCILFLTEGDAASKPINAVADRRYMGNYPLKGKPLNVSAMLAAKLRANEEFSNIMTIMGLQIGVEVKDPNDLYFGKVAFMTDADVDGSHISGLLCNMFHTFWPELFKLGIIHLFITPIIKVYMGKKVIDFYSEIDFKEWREKNKDVKFKFKYFKGLGTSKNEDFKKYLLDLDMHLIPLTIEDNEDKEIIDLVFNGSRANDRKDWLNLKEK